MPRTNAILWEVCAMGMPKKKPIRSHPGRLKHALSVREFRTYKLMVAVSVVRESGEVVYVIAALLLQKCYSRTLRLTFDIRLHHATFFSSAYSHIHFLEPAKSKPTVGILSTSYARAMY